MTALVKVNNLLNKDIQQHVFGDIIKRSVVGELPLRVLRADASAGRWMLDGPVDRPVAGSTFLAPSNQHQPSCSRAVSAYTISPPSCNRDGIWPFFKISSSPFVRSRAPRGCRATVILTLALGIGANASIFSVVRGVLLRPLVNRDESRLIYIRQSAPGNGVENSTFSVPEIIDLKDRLKTPARRSGSSRPSPSRWSASASRGRCAPASSTATTSR